MIDPITVAIGSTTVAAVGTGVNLVQLKKNSDLEKKLKRQRLEINAIEGATVLIAVATACESFLWKRRMMSKQGELELRIANLEAGIGVLNDRINGIDLDVMKESVQAQSAKIDAVLEKVSNKEDDKNVEENNN